MARLFPKSEIQLENPFHPPPRPSPSPSPSPSPPSSQSVSSSQRPQKYQWTEEKSLRVVEWFRKLNIEKWATKTPKYQQISKAMNAHYKDIEGSHHIPCTPRIVRDKRDRLRPLCVEGFTRIVESPATISWDRETGEIIADIEALNELILGSRKKTADKMKRVKIGRGFSNRVLAKFYQMLNTRDQEVEVIEEEEEDEEEEAGEAGEAGEADEEGEEDDDDNEEQEQEEQQQQAAVSDRDTVNAVELMDSTGRMDQVEQGMEQNGEVHQANKVQHVENDEEQRLLQATEGNQEARQLARQIEEELNTPRITPISPIAANRVKNPAVKRRAPQLKEPTFDETPYGQYKRQIDDLRMSEIVAELTGLVKANVFPQQWMIRLTNCIPRPELVEICYPFVQSAPLLAATVAKILLDHNRLVTDQEIEWARVKLMGQTVEGETVALNEGFDFNLNRELDFN